MFCLLFLAEKSWTEIQLFVLLQVNQNYFLLWENKSFLFNLCSPVAIHMWVMYYSSVKKHEFHVLKIIASFFLLCFLRELVWNIFLKTTLCYVLSQARVVCCCSSVISIELFRSAGHRHKCEISSQPLAKAWIISQSCFSIASAQL